MPTWQPRLVCHQYFYDEPCTAKYRESGSQGGVVMRNRRSLAVGIIGLLALAGLPTGSHAQTTPPAAGTKIPGPPCNLLHDHVPSDPQNPLSSDPNQLTHIDATTKDKILRSGLPCAETAGARGPAKTDIENRQRGFDFYSWLTFIALNAPAHDPKAIASSHPDTPTVWEDSKNFIQLLDVMLPGGDKPEWGKKLVPPACQSRYDANKSLMIVKMIEESFNEPFKTGPLIDQRNNYAIFDILMNKAMFDYIVDEKHPLYSQAHQMSELNSDFRIDFPAGRHDKSGGGDPGSIMIKVSWKILTPEDNKNKFHHVQALVSMPGSADGKSDPPCLEKTLGLVGFHVVHKTASRPQWIWTSFEHVDNVPEQKDVDARNLRRSYNFYDPSCNAEKCPVNETPPRPWDPEAENELQFRRSSDGKMIFNSQIARTVPLTDATTIINGQFQYILSDTVWKNYMLIGTQWPSAFPCSSDHSPVAAGAPEPRTDFDKQPDMNCAPAPTFLANSTLETYSQGLIPQASSNCMGCHGNATSYLRGPKNVQDQSGQQRLQRFMNQSDFTFMLEKAFPPKRP
jgi:hypothetical protein